MPEISVELEKALARGDAMFLLAEIDHPAGMQFIWSRTGTLSYNGNTYRGFGILGRITGVKRSTDIAINEVIFKARGVSPTTDTFLSGSVRNRSAKVWLGAISRRGKVTVDTDPMIDARLDYQSLKGDPSAGTGELWLVGQQGFFVLDRSQRKAWSEKQQQDDYPGDTGMNYLHTLTKKDSNWRAA